MTKNRVISELLLVLVPANISSVPANFFSTAKYFFIKNPGREADDLKKRNIHACT